MEKEFVPYELALRLKNLGFNETCFGRYGEIDNLEFRFFKETKSFEYGIDSKTCLAPTFSQAFRWFRKNYMVHSSPKKYDETKWWVEWGTWTSPVFETFEEAELSWLNKLLEIVEQKQK